MVKIANIVFNPFVNDSRVIKESVSLVKNGYEVEVIAHGNKGLVQQEFLNGFKVSRLNYLDRKVTTSKKDKFKMYISWMQEVAVYVKEFDVLHCNDLNTLPIAFIVKKFYNKDVKIVYDAHEYETEINGLRGIQKMMVKFLERSLIKYADAVICVSDAIADEYVKLYNIKKPALILNTPPYKEIEKKDIFRETFDIGKDKRIFLYQGSISKGRGVKIVVESFQRVQNTNAVIVFMGYGELETYIKEIANKESNIYFHPAVSPDILLEYTSSADFGIATIEDSCLSYRYCLPNKMFEYIMAEIPVIVSNLPEMKKIVQDYEIGVIANTNSSQGLQEAIAKAVQLDKRELLKNIQKVKEIYNWQEQEKVLFEVYKDLENENKINQKIVGRLLRYE